MEEPAIFKVDVTQISLLKEHPGAIGADKACSA